MYEQIASNKRSSTFLIIILFLIVFGLGYFLAELFFGYTILVLPIFMIIFLLIVLVQYYKGDKLVLRVNHAKQADEKKYKHLHNTVEGLALAAGVPKPKVYVVEDPSLNAFATGRDPAHSSIAVTTGVLQKMNRLELEGIIAHEMSHIKNYDIRFMTLVVVMVGLLGIFANIFVRIAFYGGISGRGKGSGWMIVIGIVAAIVAYISAQLIRFAISRRREYLADASGAMLTRYPDGLAGALEKIKASKVPTKTANQATASLYIANPFRGKGFLNLFSTHPPIDERIKKLRQM